MATELTVTLPNKPGQLAEIASALGNAGVNIDSLAATTAGGKGTIRLVVSDPARAKRALKAAKIRVANQREVIEIRLANKPGALARVAKRLGKARVNIDTAYLLGQTKTRAVLALGVKDVRAAKRALRR